VGCGNLGLETNQKQEVEFAAFVGIGWADQKHAWALQIPGIWTSSAGIWITHRKRSKPGRLNWGGDSA